MTVNETPDFLTTRESMQYLRVSRSTIERLIRSGALPCKRIASSGHRRIKLRDVENLLEARSGK